MKPFFISVPHSGERLPQEALWLTKLPETTVMCDVDRFVDVLYRPAAEKLAIPFLVAEWHRYAADLNRLPNDIDTDAVDGAPNPSGQFTTGLHWVKTTKGQTLMDAPISMELHKLLVEKYFQPFHDKIKSTYEAFKSEGHERVFHIDAHSMPSVGTSAHRDPGELRSEIVVSDVDGKSAMPAFKDLVGASFEKAGFEVAYNWPYKGGRLTQTYGQPEKGQHVIQVEMRRSLYMDEVSKKLDHEKSKLVQAKIIDAISNIDAGIDQL